MMANVFSLAAARGWATASVANSMRSINRQLGLLAGHSPAGLVLWLLVLGFCLGGCATSKLGASGQQKVKGKTYVIIGASSGFGRGMAEQLGAYKANVVLAARRTDLL